MDKEQQAKLLTEIVEAAQKNGLYDIPNVEKKRTAVEWFWNEIAEVLPFTVDSTTAIKMYDKLQQAKQMEKEQIINAFGVGCQVESTRLIGYHGMAEQYYNETYNK